MEKRPLKTAGAPGRPGSKAEAMAASFEQRITSFVERQIERQMEKAMSEVESREKPKPPKVKTGRRWPWKRR